MANFRKPTDQKLQNNAGISKAKDVNEDYREAWNIINSIIDGSDWDNLGINTKKQLQKASNEKNKKERNNILNSLVENPDLGIDIKKEIIKAVNEVTTKIKRKHTEEHPAVYINPEAKMRNKIVEFIGGNDKCRCTKSSLKEFMNSLAEDEEIGKCPNKNYITSNKRLFREVNVGKTPYVKLTGIGKRVYNHLKEQAEQAMNEADVDLSRIKGADDALKAFGIIGDDAKKILDMDLGGASDQEMYNAIKKVSDKKIAKRLMGWWGADTSKLNEAQRQVILHYKDEEYEIWHEVPDGYYAVGKGVIKDKIAKTYFDKQDEAEEHAKLEIDGYLENTNEAIVDQDEFKKFMDELDSYYDPIEDNVKQEIENLVNKEGLTLEILPKLSRLVGDEESFVYDILAKFVGESIQEAEIGGDKNIKTLISNTIKKAYSSAVNHKILSDIWGFIEKITYFKDGNIPQNQSAIGKIASSLGVDQADVYKVISGAILASPLFENNDEYKEILVEYANITPEEAAEIIKNRTLEGKSSVEFPKYTREQLKEFKKIIDKLNETWENEAKLKMNNRGYLTVCFKEMLEEDVAAKYMGEFDKAVHENELLGCGCGAIKESKLIKESKTVEEFGAVITTLNSEWDYDGEVSQDEDGNFVVTFADGIPPEVLDSYIGDIQEADPETRLVDNTENSARFEEYESGIEDVEEDTDLNLGSSGIPGKPKKNKRIKGIEFHPPTHNAPDAPPGAKDLPAGASEELDDEEENKEKDEKKVQLKTKTFEASKGYYGIPLTSKSNKTLLEVYNRFGGKVYTGWFKNADIITEKYREEAPVKFRSSNEWQKAKDWLLKHYNLKPDSLSQVKDGESGTWKFYKDLETNKSIASQDPIARLSPTGKLVLYEPVVESDINESDEEWKALGGNVAGTLRVKHDLKDTKLLDKLEKAIDDNIKSIMQSGGVSSRVNAWIENHAKELNIDAKKLEDVINDEIDQLDVSESTGKVEKISDAVRDFLIHKKEISEKEDLSYEKLKELEGKYKPLELTGSEKDYKLFMDWEGTDGDPKYNPEMKYNLDTGYPEKSK